jgi:hypothetical protein
MREDELVRAEPTNIDQSELASELGQGWRIRIFDDLSTKAAASGKHVVVIHGELHPANLLRADDGLFLVDWDTLGADAAERDLWWLDGHPDAPAQFERATGRILPRPLCAAGLSEHLCQRYASHPENAGFRLGKDLIGTRRPRRPPGLPVSLEARRHNGAVVRARHSSMPDSG